jgi:hypothetical protein
MASDDRQDGPVADPLPWLLEADDPAVRHVAPRDLVGRHPGDPDLAAARTLAMAADPIASIRAAQQPAGYWEKPVGRASG